MNILLINHYAGSVYHGMEFRPYYMAREWVKAGHNVTILAADYSHLRKKNPDIAKDFSEEIIDGIKYVWVKTNSYKGNSIGRALNIYSFVRKTKKAAKKIAEKYRPDAVISSSTYPLDIYPAHRISEFSGARLYFEIHDLWPLTPQKMANLSDKNPLIVLLQKAEDFAFEKSKKIISILPDADRHIEERGFDASKFVHIPNGVILDELNTQDSKEEEQIKYLKQLKEQGYFIVAYTGNHSPANNLETLIDASTCFEPSDMVKCVSIGKGTAKPQLINYAKEKNAENMVFLDPVRKESIFSLLSVVDLAYMGLKKDDLFSYGVSPNKLFDYMLASKPIIYSVEASNDPVSEANCGITIPASDHLALAEAIRKLRQLSKQELTNLGRNGKEYVMKNHEYSVLADKFLSELTD